MKRDFYDYCELFGTLIIVLAGPIGLAAATIFCLWD